MGNDALVEVAVGIEEVAGRPQEAPAPAKRMEPDDVVGEQAVMKGVPDLLRSTRQRFGSGHGMWTKWASAASGRASRT